MSEEKRGWYVLRAISGEKENKVKRVLDAEIKNTDLGNYVAGLDTYKSLHRT